MKTIPKMTIKQMRIFYGKDSDTVKVFDAILQGLVKEYWQNKKFRELNIGLEGSFEAVEELINKGWLKICHNEDEGTFYLVSYDEEKNEYQERE